ncbi:3-deoxy-7-phosphoheptulonate synthase [Vibrio stylophorae]|nr:3-deoxy-7-phosphoheptulonate synthase [Vibrio stylophorae]
MSVFAPRPSSLATDELRTEKLTTLITPAELSVQLPITESIQAHIVARRQAIEAILTGEDHRLLVIIGPCSIHDTQAALDYAEQLAALQRNYQDELVIVMRSYFEKPRTVVGWKGLVSDPNLDGSFDINLGLHTARQLLLKINAMGLATATEFLDTVTGQYLSDLISWGAIGARTTESQVHREMASALSCPIGFKNGTDGNIQIAIDAIRATRVPHLFCSADKDGRMTAYRSCGNPYGHVILRGGKTPNYFAKDIDDACQQLQSFGLHPRLIVDFSHGNCQKQHKQQLDVAENICKQLRQGNPQIAGIMAESFLIEGQQNIDDKPLTYGQSITDPCLNWQDTAYLIDQLAKANQQRLRTIA